MDSRRRSSVSVVVSCAGAVALVLLLSIQTVAAQQATITRSAQQRLKVGLALSGGGARGAAHIGVIRVLEEHRVPIDYIAGTSLGAIIGGLYASGMSTDDIEAAMLGIEWGEVFTDPTPRRDRSFRRKRDDDSFLVKYKPGVGSEGLKLPAGVVQGQKIDLVLSRLTLPVAHIKDFDELMVPFRAVASDIATGQEVVLGSGSLARALRASMSIPAAIAPTRLAGSLLVDGGVANNLPINVVRGMGADVVIAVDLSTPLLPQEEIDSVLAITEQLTSILTRRNTDAQIATLNPRDVLIVPDLGGIRTTDFHRVQEAIPLGRDASVVHLETLRTLALSESEYSEYRASLRLPGSEPPVIDFIRLDNRSRLADEVIEAKIRETRAGAPLDVDAIQQDVGRIYGLELFQNVRYVVVQENGKTGLEIEVEDRSWGPAYLEFGASYASAGDGDDIFNLAVSYLLTGLNPSGGEWRSTVILGEEPGVSTELHQPLGRRSRYFISPEIGFETRNANVFENNNVLAQFRVTEKMFQISGGREFGTWGEVRIGLRNSDGDAEVEIGDPMLADLEFESGEAFLRLSLDKLDSVNFPRSGSAATAEWIVSRDGLGAETPFDQFQLDALSAKTWGRHTFLFRARYGTTFSGEAPIQSLFRLGGFGDLSGFNENELSGQHFGVLSTSYFRRIGDIALLPVYAGVSVEIGNAWEDRDRIALSDSLWAGNIFAGVDSPVGPLYLAYGQAEGGFDAFYFFLGRIF